MAPIPQMAIASAAGLALVLPRLAAGCDSSYVFPNTTEDGAPLSDADPLVRIEAGLQWQQYPQNGSVYLAMAFGVGKVEERQGIARRPCSSGYMGGQIHEDGTHHLLFSMWDWNATLHTAFGMEPRSTDGGATGCSAFGGEGTGGHCGAPLKGDEFMWEVGTRYTFAAWMERADAQFHNYSGVVWQAQVTNEATARVTNIGQIFIRDDFLGGPELSHCAQMTPGAYSFMEYFYGNNYYSAATWRGPAYTAQSGKTVVASNASPCCASLSNVWSPTVGKNVSRNETNRVCTPPQCDQTEVFFEDGVFPLDLYSPAATICGIADCRPNETFCNRLCDVGHGSCSNQTDGYPPMLGKVVVVANRAACEAKCTALGESCAAYSFCSEPACVLGSCGLYPGPVSLYTKCNGYPGNTCYVRPK